MQYHQLLFAMPLHLISTLTAFQTLSHVLTQRRSSSRISQSYGSHFQYLTVIALLLSFFTFLTSLIHSVMTFFPSSTPTTCTRTSTTSSSIARSIRQRRPLDRLHRTLRFIAAPVELTIAAVYWPLYFLDPSLLTEKRSLPPVHLDVALHLLPAAFLVLDYVVVLPPDRRLRVDSRLALVFYAAFLAGYVVWLAECQRRNGFWAYPVLERVGVEVMAIGFVVLTGFLGVMRELVLVLRVRVNPCLQTNDLFI